MREGCPGGRKSPYPEEFRKDAVALYPAAAGKRTYAAVTADLGITTESLRTWVRKNEAQTVPEGSPKLPYGAFHLSGPPMLVGGTDG